MFRSNIRFTGLIQAAFLAALSLLDGNVMAAPDYDLVGFAALDGMGQSGTTGGAGGPHIQVSTLNELVRYAQTNVMLRIEVMNDIDLSPLANANQGFPANYPTGEI